jgi:hypothetical protein
MDSLNREQAAKDEGLKIENINKPITKRKSEQSLMKDSFKNN